MQDHSVLEPNATEDQIRSRCEETLRYGFGATYVNPCYVTFAKSILGDKAKVGTVVGFPHGANTTKVKIIEGLQAIDDGADKLDLVINISKLRSGDLAYVTNELSEFLGAMKKHRDDIIVKVIIETCYLSHDEKVAACEIVAESGADFIKTSTGTGTAGSRIGDIRLMKRIVGDRVKIKAADQIKTIEDALAVIEEGATAIGESSGINTLADFDKELWTKPDG